MKVALLSSGASIHTIRWVNGLADAGIEVLLVTQHELFEPVNDRVLVRLLPHSGIVGYFRNARPLKRVLEEEQPDLLNAHYASGYGTTARFAGFHPYVLSVWGADVYDVPERTRLHRWLVRRNVLAADQVTSTSHVMARQTTSIVPEQDNIEVVPFGIDVDRFQKTSELDSSADSTIVVGTVKTMAHKYGIDTLLESFALLIRKLSSSRPGVASRLRLRIVGGGPDLDTLKDTAHQLGISTITDFIGKVNHENVSSELCKLDIYVALSRLDSESFGVAILEASACGLPVVVSDAGGLPEVVLDGTTGYVVPRENPNAAADALEKLVLDPELRRAMGEEGRNHVLENYQWPKNVQDMIAVYERTIGCIRNNRKNK